MSVFDKVSNSLAWLANPSFDWIGIQIHPNLMICPLQGGKRAGMIGKILLQNKADCNMWETEPLKKLVERIRWRCENFYGKFVSSCFYCHVEDVRILDWGWIVTSGLHCIWPPEEAVLMTLVSYLSASFSLLVVSVAWLCANFDETKMRYSLAMSRIPLCVTCLTVKHL